MTVNVLGASYTLKFIPEEEDEGLKDCDGYCDETIKTLVVKLSLIHISEPTRRS